MKKHFFFLLASIFTFLFAACSQESELDATPQEKSNLVSISTQLPADFAKTRALPTATNHKLRCILEVWSKEATPTLLSRHEKLGAESDERISFTFEVTEGTYDCLMWADFVESSAAATDMTQGAVTFQGYEDKFYTTTDLKAVVVKDVNSLFNTEACDAFFGVQELVKGATAATVSASLSRPFAKLTIKEKDAESYAKCTKLSVSYTVPTTLNVADGAISGSTLATYTGATAGNSVYFTHYILADADETLENILLSFTTANGTIEKTIPSGVPTKRNYRTNASGNFIPKQSSPGEATVDITFGNDWLDDNSDSPVTPGTPVVEDPKVGDFYYSDGSYSTNLNGSKTCIGVVFAVGAQESDAAANYDGKITGEIKGYVIALTDATTNAKWCATTTDEAPLPTIDGISANAKDFNGYTNSGKAIAAFATTEREYLAVSSCATYDVAAPAATSDWYLPSNGQLAAIAASYYTKDTDTKGILHTQLNAVSGLFAATNYWSSSYNNSSNTTNAGRPCFRMSFNAIETNNNYGTNSSGALATHIANVRAILTF